jgi:DNA-binding Lrp family transcriptional regulator
VKIFKLNVRFEIGDNKKNFRNQTSQKPIDKAVALNPDEKMILSSLQKELQITAEPFSFLSGGQIESKDVLRIIRELITKSVIRRIAAVIDYRQLGFTANVLFACEISQVKVIEAGEKLASSELVSHCYERKTFKDWPYNLFAMMHSKSMDDIHKLVDEFVKSEKIKSYQLLSTIAELKKEPVSYNFQ